MNNNKICIICPVYNCEKYLDKCITSIIKQTFENFVLILINDGSTDNSLSVCHEWQKKDKRIKVITQDNKGVYVAKTNGIKFALTLNPKYLAFVDSDDYIEPNFLQSLYDAALKEKADIAECWVKKVDENGNTMAEIKINDPYILNSKELEIGYASKIYSEDYLCNKLYLAKHFTNLPNTYFKCSEDYYLNTIIFSKIKKKVTIKDFLYNYVQRKGSLDSELMNDKKMDNIYAREAIFDYYKNQGKVELANLTAYQITSCTIILIKECKYIDKKLKKKYKKLLRNSYKKYFKYALKADFKNKLLNTKRKIKLIIYYILIYMI